MFCSILKIFEEYYKYFANIIDLLFFMCYIISNI